MIDGASLQQAQSPGKLCSSLWGKNPGRRSEPWEPDLHGFPQAPTFKGFQKTMLCFKCSYRPEKDLLASYLTYSIVQNLLDGAVYILFCITLLQRPVWPVFSNRTALNASISPIAIQLLYRTTPLFPYYIFSSSETT